MYIACFLREVGSGGTDLRSYPSHAVGAGPSRSRATGGYAPGTHIPSGNRPNDYVVGRKG